MWLCKVIGVFYFVENPDLEAHQAPFFVIPHSLYSMLFSALWERLQTVLQWRGLVDVLLMYAHRWCLLTPMLIANVKLTACQSRMVLWFFIKGTPLSCSFTPLCSRDVCVCFGSVYVRVCVCHYLYCSCLKQCFRINNLLS